MSLKDLIRTVHGPEDLLPKLDVFLLQLEKKPSNRSGGWHPSGFHSMCPRMEVIAHLTNVHEPFDIDPKLRRIFDNGTALHDWYHNRYLGPMGILWGRWKCSRCGHTDLGFMPTEKCPCNKAPRCTELCGDGKADLAFPRLDSEKQAKRGGCNHCRIWGEWTYDEIPVSVKIPIQEVFDVTTGLPETTYLIINGSSDGVLVIGNRWLVIEIKTINDRGFNMLPEAQEKHVRQAMLYTRLLQHDMREAEGFFGKLPEEPEGLLVLYINKNDARLKEFYVPFDRKFADRLVEAPVQYERALLSKEIPDRIPECKSMFTKRAKDCSLCSVCFGGNSWDDLVQMGRKT